MKKVTIKHSFSKGIVLDYIKLESEEDLFNYFNVVEQELSEHVNQLFASGVPITKWDHCCEGGHGGSVFAGVVTDYHVTGENPLYKLGSMTVLKMKQMRKMIEKEGHVLVNHNGGCCYFNPSRHEILEEIEHELMPNKKLTYEIKIKTKYINLENNSNIEKHSFDYLKEKDHNFSQITNLRRFSKKDLLKVFSEFKHRGGEVVYVFTTACAIDQMKMYSEAVVESGLTRVEFDFNSGVNSDVLKVIQYLEENNVNVDWWEC